MLTYQVYPWFHNANVTLSFFLALTALLVAILSYYIYNLTDQKQLKYFSFGFLSFAIAYIVRATTKLLLPQINSAQRLTLKGIRGLVEYSMSLNFISSLSKIVFFMVGLLLLLRLVMKFKDKFYIWVVAVFSFFVIFFSGEALFAYHIIASALFGIISMHYFKNYEKHKGIQCLLVFIGFILLFTSHFIFIFSFQKPIFNLAGSMIELIAFICIIINMIMVITKK